MQLKSLVLSLSLLPTLTLAAPICGQGLAALSIDGDRVEAEIVLGDLDVELELELEHSVGLDPASLGLSARRVAPAEVASRLGADTRLASAAPLLVSFDPPSDRGLAFRGVYTLELKSRALRHTDGGGLRLYRARPGGRFVDATAGIGSGSLRAVGAGAAEFLVVIDRRPPAAASAAAADRLEQLLSDGAPVLDGELYGALWSWAGAARDAWERGETRPAVRAIEALIEEARAGSMPRIWRSSRDLDNFEGELRAAASSLRLSLLIAPPQS